MNKTMKQHIIQCIFILLGTLIGLLLGSSHYYYSPFYTYVTKATAVIHPTKGNSASGVVLFEYRNNVVHITADISGLTPGKHGFHIHEFGNCACNDGGCTGGHFNPTNQPHGGPHNPNRHAGDMGNIVADQQGKGHYESFDTLMTLNGPYSIIGRGIIIHTDSDDLTSQPTGNSGARIGCGTIGIAEEKPLANINKN